MQETKIGLREYIAIIVFCLVGKVTDDTPVHFYSTLYNAAWMPVIIGGIIMIFPLYLLFSVLKKYENKDLLDIIFDLLGKRLGWIFIFGLWFVQTFYLVVDSAIQKDIIGTMYYINVNPLFVYSIFMSICAYGAWKGIQAISSTAVIMFIFLQVTFFFSLILTYGQGQNNFLFPFFGPGEWEVIKVSFVNISLFTDFLYFFILITALKKKSDFIKGTWIGLFIIVVEVTLALITYLVLFDYKTINLLSYPYHEVIRFISLGFLTNMESMFFFFWIIATTIRFSVYLYIDILIFGRLFNIKKFHYLAPIMAVLVVFLGSIPNNPSFNLTNFKFKYIHTFSFIFLALPIILWVLSRKKGGSSNEEKTT